MKARGRKQERKGKKPAADCLVGERTVMRPVKPEDLPFLEAWDRDPEITALMGRKFEETDVRQWYRELSASRNNRALAIETREGGRLIGELELAQLNWRTGTAELRICIGAKDCWDKGYGSDALRTALRVAFDGYELRSVYLRVYASNARAVRVYERLGFRRDAVLQPSARRDDPSPVILMTLTRERWERTLSQSA